MCTKDVRANVVGDGACLVGACNFASARIHPGHHAHALKNTRTHSNVLVNVPSVDPAHRNPLWFSAEFVHSRLQFFKRTVQVVVDDNEIEVVSIRPENTGTLVDGLLQVDIL